MKKVLFSFLMLFGALALADEIGEIYVNIVHTAGEGDRNTAAAAAYRIRQMSGLTQTIINFVALYSDGWKEDASAVYTEGNIFTGVRVQPLTLRGPPRAPRIIDSSGDGNDSGSGSGFVNLGGCRPGVDRTVVVGYGSYTSGYGDQFTVTGYRNYAYLPNCG